MARPKKKRKNPPSVAVEVNPGTYSPTLADVQNLLLRIFTAARPDCAELLQGTKDPSLLSVWKQVLSLLGVPGDCFSVRAIPAKEQTQPQLVVFATLTCNRAMPSHVRHMYLQHVGSVDGKVRRKPSLALRSRHEPGKLLSSCSPAMS